MPHEPDAVVAITDPCSGRLWRESPTVLAPHPGPSPKAISDGNAAPGRNTSPSEMVGLRFLRRLWLFCDALEAPARAKLLTTVIEGPHKRFAIRALKVALVVFHAWLLWQRVADWSILEPAVLAKWAGAIALVAGTLLFQRFVPRAARGMRAAVVFWLLVLLLHIAPFADVRDVEAEVVAFAQLTLVVAVTWLFARITLAPSRSRWALRAERIPVRLSDARTRVAPRSPSSR